MKRSSSYSSSLLPIWNFIRGFNDLWMSSFSVIHRWWTSLAVRSRCVGLFLSCTFSNVTAFADLCSTNVTPLSHINVHFAFPKWFQIQTLMFGVLGPRLSSSYTMSCGLIPVVAIRVYPQRDATLYIWEGQEWHLISSRLADNFMHNPQHLLQLR